MMRWTVLAPFFLKSNVEQDVWLDDFVPVGRHHFKKILRQDCHVKLGGWHDRASRNTPLSEWRSYWRQSGDAWNATTDGCITVFPQLASMVGLRKNISKRSVPAVAWCFNVGALYSGVKRILAKSTLRNIDKFIVHSKRECETVSAWLDIDVNKFCFVPLQRAAIEIVEEEDCEKPFILAMGSANRDYKTLFHAVKRSGIRTIVVAKASSISRGEVPSNVEIRSGLKIDECRRLAQKAKINIIPLIDNQTAAGQVTIVEAMRMRRAVIATRCVGSEDYIRHGNTGLLVNPYSATDLESAISQLWSDDKLRYALASEAGKYAEENFSDEVVGKKLEDILNKFL